MVFFTFEQSFWGFYSSTANSSYGNLLILSGLWIRVRIHFTSWIRIRIQYEDPDPGG